MWNLPFYKQTYELENYGIINKITTYIKLLDFNKNITYIKMVDNKMDYEVEIFRFYIVYYSKNIFTKKEKFKSKYVTFKDVDFEKYVEQMFKGLKIVTFNDLSSHKLLLKLM